MPCHPTAAALDLLGFLTLGLLGSFGHCVGMCSPFVLFVSRRYGRTTTSRAEALLRPALLAQAWYTTGRLVTYAVLGALAGSVGLAVQKAGALVGLRRGALLVAGAVLIAWAVVALSDLGALRGDGRLFARVTGLLKGQVPGHPFATGLFLGLLPCGFLYTAVIAAVALGDALRGAAALALFGLGTAPALIGVSVADDLLTRNRALLNRLSQVFILVMGARFLWRAFAG